MYKFHNVSVESLNKDNFNGFDDKIIYNTKEWIEFVKNTQKIKPLILKIENENYEIGFFIGFIFEKFLIKIIGSPFRGWTTMYMGLNINNAFNEHRIDIIKELWIFLKKEYRCKYFEIIDRKLKETDLDESIVFTKNETYIKPLNNDIETIFKSFNSTCRNQIRRFEKNMAKLEICEPNEEFALEYYEQLKKVFAYQNLYPSYDYNRVVELFNSLKQIPNSLYCTKINSPEGKCIGTLISFGYNKTCYLWGLTSIREENYYQSDYLVWDSIMHWKSLNYVEYDLVGIRDYKTKFRPERISIPRIIFSKSKLLIKLRNIAQKIYWKFNKFKRKIIWKK